MSLSRTLGCVGVLFALAGIACSDGDEGGGGVSPTPPPTPPVVLTTRYVADNGTDAGACTSQSPACRTIQYAHGQSIAGDTINVSPGTYSGNVAISKGVTLRGTSGSAMTKLVGGIDVGSGPIGDLTIEGFSLTPGSSGAGNGIRLQGVRQLTIISDVVITGYSGRGIDAVMLVLGGLRIQNSLVTGSGADGVRIDESQGSVGGSGVTLRNVRAAGNAGDGIQLSGLTDRDILLDGVRADVNGEAGIQVETLQGGKISINNSCIHSNGSEAGIFLLGIGPIPSTTNQAQVKANLNNIFSNSAGGAQLVTSNAFTADMQNNWWGVANGPSGPGRSGSGNFVSAGITVDPVATSLVAGTPCS